ncbi:MAG TPA: efflux RND transporter periplasmic adaptor subunit [Gammaproteobacteria bacterium]|nr:efflux RND transporter periplasmic adaptor subunit [Gammaproteobacteria bacterium]
MKAIAGDIAANAARTVSAALLLLGLVSLEGRDAHGEAAKQTTPPPPEVDVARVEAHPVTLTETFTGRVEAPETVDLRPRVTGYIDKVAFKEGERVQAGDLLFEIDPRPYQARVAAARAELAQARSDLQLASSQSARATRLLKSHAISREEYDRRQAARQSARARIDAARAALRTASLNLQCTGVTAPVSGRTGRAMVTRGNLARADQTLLTTVVSVSPVYVYFQSNEASAVSRASLLDGHGPVHVRIGLEGEDDLPHEGTLDFVDNRLNPGTGTLQYRAVLPNPTAASSRGSSPGWKCPLPDCSTPSW